MFLRQCRYALIACQVQVQVQPKAKISGRAARGGPLQLPLPFPYKEKPYNVWAAFRDKTSWRFNENSKIILVEGPIASGKTAFAKTLAEELDMLHMPAITMDDIYINDYGFDLRCLDPDLPENARSFDEKKFLANPKHRSVATFQMEMYALKYATYIDCLAHVLNTGQGVVMERSPHSDFVFVEAMLNAGYVTKKLQDYYYDIRNHSIIELMRPHLAIYLDVPVSVVQENIKKRNLPHEVNSKALTPSYLADIEKFYKDRFLKEISIHAELLVYDWSKGGDVEVVVEDIERIDFDRFEKNDKKLKDWRFGKEWDLCEERIMVSSRKSELMTYLNSPRYDVPELIIDGDEFKALRDAYENAPGLKYAKGYNADMGDKNFLFKTKTPNRYSKIMYTK